MSSQVIIGATGQVYRVTGLDEGPASGPVDKAVARELVIFIDNDQMSYRHLQDAYKNLVVKLSQGRYKRDMAVALFMYVVDAAAKRYMKDADMSGNIDTLANKKTRQAVAEELRDAFEELLKDGDLDYKQWVPKKYSEVDIVANLGESHHLFEVSTKRDILILYVGDGSVAAAADYSDVPRGREMRYFGVTSQYREFDESGEWQIARVKNVPTEVADNLVKHGGIMQVYDDGYDAARIASKFPHVVVDEGENYSG